MKVGFRLIHKNQGSLTDQFHQSRDRKQDDPVA